MTSIHAFTLHISMVNNNFCIEEMFLKNFSVDKTQMLFKQRAIRYSKYRMRLQNCCLSVFVVYINSGSFQTNVLEL